MKILPCFYKNSSFSQKLIYIFIFIVSLSFFALLLSLIIDFEYTIIKLTQFYYHSFGSDFEYVYKMGQLSSPYTESIDSNQTPLSYLIMKYLGLVFKHWLAAYIVFHIGAMVLCYVVLYKMIKQKKIIKILLLICIVVSLPFLFTIERGNHIVWAFLFSILFFYFYRGSKEKTDRLKKEFSYLFLALASALKIYPLIFIIFIVLDKNLMGVIKTILYSAVLLLLPFLFFEGGFKNLGLFIENLRTWGDLIIIYRSVNITNIFYHFIRIFRIETTISFMKAGSIISITYFFIACFAVIFIKKKYKILTLLSTLIILIPQISFEYCLIFMAPALIAFLNQEHKNKNDIVIFICYITLFISFPFGYLIYDANWKNIILINTPFQVVALLTISLIYTIDGYINMARIIRKKTFFKNLLNLLMFRRDKEDLDFSNGILAKMKNTKGEL